MVSKAAITFSDNVSDELHNASAVGEEEFPPMYLNIIVQPLNSKKIVRNSPGLSKLLVPLEKSRNWFTNCLNGHDLSPWTFLAK